MKRVVNDGLDYEPIARTYERIIEFAKAGQFAVNAVYEWYSFQKINAVPINKTAFPRRLKPISFIVVGWSPDTHSEEKTEEGWRVMEEIAACITGGEIPIWCSCSA